MVGTDLKRIHCIWECVGVHPAHASVPIKDTTYKNPCLSHIIIGDLIGLNVRGSAERYIFQQMLVIQRLQSPLFLLSQKVRCQVHLVIRINWNNQIGYKCS